MEVVEVFYCSLIPLLTGKLPSVAQPSSTSEPALCPPSSLQPPAVPLTEGKKDKMDVVFPLQHWPGGDLSYSFRIELFQQTCQVLVFPV